MIERLIRLLEHEQQQIAAQAMESPARDQFDHGIVVGRYQGLSLARELVHRVLMEADEKERELERRL